MARPTNALIVDDEPHVRVFLRLMLRELGITKCWEAGDGVTALELVQAEKPEIVLLDINLPRLNGMEVLTKLHEQGSTIPIVMVTSQSAVAIVSEAMRLGAIGFLLKHSPKEETTEMLRDLLDSLANDEPDEANDVI